MQPMKDLKVTVDHDLVDAKTQRVFHAASMILAAQKSNGDTNIELD